MYTDHTNHGNDMSGRGRGGPHDRELRVADADREAAAKVLRRHYADGRLDAEEFNERIDRCYQAKKVGELEELFAGLPRDEPREPESERGYRDRRPPWAFAAVASIIAALIVVSALTGTHVFWLAWPLAFLVLGPFGLFGRQCRVGRNDGRVT